MNYRKEFTKLYESLNIECEVNTIKVEIKRGPQEMES